MIKEMLKTAGVDNMEDFYKLHPTEEHFFKTYPHMKDKVKKSKKLRKPKMEEGGPAPGKVRLFSLPGGFHYDIDADNAQYLAGTLIDPGHATTPAVKQALVARKAAAAKAAAAAKPMYSPEVLARIKAEAHQLNEDELRNHYHATSTQRAANDQVFENRAYKAAAMQSMADDINKSNAKKPSSTSKSSYKLAKGGSEAVAKFQEMLNKQTGSTLVPDGAWGPKTQAAYEQYMAMKSGKTKPEASAQSFKFNAANVYADDMANPDMSMSIDPGKEEPAPSRPYGMVGPPTEEEWKRNNAKRYGGYYQDGGGVDPMQIIQAYAQAAGVDPRQIVAQLKQMAPEEQQAALQQMMQELQGGGNQQGQYRDGGRLPKEVLRSRLESHMSPAEADNYLSQYADGGNFIQGVRNMIRRPRRQSSEEMMQQVMQDASDNFKKERNPEKVFNYIQSQGLSEQDAILMLRQIMDRAENDDEYARGGGIHINPAKKGTFTAQATRMGMGIQEAARHILANKGKYSPAMIRKANFARNAAKWKHEYGGYARMYQEGGETMGQEQMEAPQQQTQEQAMGQEQQQGGQDQMMQQLMQMVAQALQQGVPPEQIVQMLVQQGVPQEVAVQAVQMVMQQMGGGAPQGGPGQQYQPQGGQYQGPQPMAAMGGYYADGGFYNESYMPFDY